MLGNSPTNVKFKSAGSAAVHRMSEAITNNRSKHGDDACWRQEQASGWPQVARVAVIGGVLLHNQPCKQHQRTDVAANTRRRMPAQSCSEKPLLSPRHRCAAGVRLPLPLQFQQPRAVAMPMLFVNSDSSRLQLRRYSASRSDVVDSFTETCARTAREFNVYAYTTENVRVACE